MQAQLSPHELAYQESLVQEHEAEIREVETGIHELSEIFRDLGTLVTCYTSRAACLVSLLNNLQTPCPLRQRIPS
jgi:hypothetical protein